jgi:8-oxo-dGTP pyrophosphatase MutT (NUDIX family)/nicotinic acid mononucleotide adenylyltransferase
MVDHQHWQVPPFNNTVSVYVEDPDGLVYASVRRDTDTYPGYFQFPGGRVEPGESSIDAAPRELREETGLDLPIDRFQLIWSGKTETSECEDVYKVVLKANEEITDNPEPTKHGQWMTFWPDNLLAPSNKLVPPMAELLDRKRNGILELTADIQDAADMMSAEHVAYVGRFGPVHLGHHPIMDALIRAFPHNHTICIGSCNAKPSIPNLFRYSDRVEFIKTALPSARLLPLPDFGNDLDWFTALDQLLAPTDPQRVLFIGGSAEDVRFFYEHGRNVHIVNRYHGPTVHTSASEVRDCLIERRSLEGLVHQKLISLVEERFALRWAEFKKMRR